MTSPSRSSVSPAGVELAAGEFAPDGTYLNTSSAGLLPRRTVEAVTTLAERCALGVRPDASTYESVERARAAYGRLVGVAAERVAVGASASAQVSVVAASLAPGAEVLLPEGEFSSLVQPFVVRPDLKVRCVPLDELAAEVRPETALVAWSVVQSSDGRLADDGAVRAAAAAHGARTLADLSQAAGWLTVDAGAYDYTVSVGYKYLLCPRGTSFLTVSQEAQEVTLPVQAGWSAAEDIWNSTYGPIAELARSARRYDTSVPFLCYEAAVESLALVESVGVGVLGAHNVALADRLRAGLLERGHLPVPAPGSAVVAVPGLGERAQGLGKAGVKVSARAGNLRVSFHLYNRVGDVQRVLAVLGQGAR
ncbi:aminotransferase class V-fold PLP-dependent enzyme [Streptomyces sp. NBC_00237]|uniref:aminotransferase class V-fold PLP-dependent enzyme n=1 Tax=Streptomyces sp. NBC_00237 TaxID=2975687 RepID=UPI00224DB538|nr:aminotransferase class V-fold PLP-dependent enzyme [Streptomyces sp. NBC_00237]MCX5202012.1 aminotransferase class V-fold PLP-dependent enzyme [Streptomyces sp. NBC_00237]